MALFDFASWLRQAFPRSSRSAKGSRPRRTNLRLEYLEARVTPTTVTVTSSSDDPTDIHSLRYAINNAVANEEIDFDPSVRSITLSNANGNTTGLILTANNLSITNDLGTGSVTIDGAGLYTSTVTLFPGRIY